MQQQQQQQVSGYAITLQEAFRLLDEFLESGSEQTLNDFVQGLPPSTPEDLKKMMEAIVKDLIE